MSNSALTAAEPGAAGSVAEREPAPQPSFWGAVFTLWQREFRGFYRQRSRVMAGLATPLIFWLALGSGFGTSLQGSSSYLDFFFPGAVALVVLFASIFSNISIIEDRREGFLLSVLAAPVPRSALVLGKSLGATTIGAAQGLLFLPLAFTLDSPFDWAAAPEMALAILAMAFGLTNLGFYFAWKLNSMQGFHAVMNTVLMPLWLLSGALFPVEGSSVWVRWLTAVNPLTYGVTALRRAVLGEAAAGGPSAAVCWAVLAGFGALTFLLAIREASRPRAEHLS